MDTVILCRIMLENCATAREAADMLVAMIKEKAYKHGKSGSIWFIADAENAFVAENNARHIAVKPVFSGMLIRANSWDFPEMIPYSHAKPNDIVGNNRREYAVRDLLFKKHQVIGKVVTPEMMAEASRIKEFPEDKDCYPLCGPMTNTAATFVIDQEFPEDLSFASFAFGPPRCTFFIPVPATIDELPEELCNGTTGNEIFKRFRKRHWKKNWKEESELQSVEAKLNAHFYKALDNARAVLKSGKADAKKEAAAILKKAFQENWKTAAEAAKIDSRNWFDKLFDL
jgi:dipeptidase